MVPSWQKQACDEQEVLDDEGSTFVELAAAAAAAVAAVELPHYHQETREVV